MITTEWVDREGKIYVQILLLPAFLIVCMMIRKFDSIVK